MNIIKFEYDNNKNLISKKYSNNDGSITQSSRDNWIYLYTDAKYVAVDLNIRQPNGRYMPTIKMVLDEDEDGNKCWRRDLPLSYVDFRMESALTRIDLSFVLYYYNDYNSITYPTTVSSQIVIKRSITGNTATDGSYNGTDVENLWRAVGLSTHKINDLDTKIDTELEKKFDKTGGTITGNTIIKGDLDVSGVISGGELKSTTLISGVSLNLSNKITAKSGNISTLEATSLTSSDGVISELKTNKISSDNDDIIIDKNINLSNKTIKNSILDSSVKLSNNETIASKEYSDSNFVKRVKTATDNPQAYIKSTTGVDTVLDIDTKATSGTIARRGESGTLKVGTPTENSHAVNKSYLESRIGSISTAKSYTSYSDMIVDLNQASSSYIPIGSNIWIATNNVPDLWVFSKSTTSTPFNYESDTDIENKLKNPGFIDVGYYRLYPNESKINTDDIYNKDEVNELLNEKSKVSANPESTTDIINSIAIDGVSYKIEDADIGRYTEIGINDGVIENNELIFTTTEILKSNSRYFFTLHAALITREGDLPDDIPIYIVDGSNSKISLTSINQPSINSTATTGDLSQIERSDPNTGFYWYFMGNYRELENNTKKVIYIDTINCEQYSVMSGDDFASAISNIGVKPGQFIYISKTSTNNLYKVGHTYKITGNYDGSSFELIEEDVSILTGEPKYTDISSTESSGDLNSEQIEELKSDHHRAIRLTNGDELRIYKLTSYDSTKGVLEYSSCSDSIIRVYESTNKWVKSITSGLVLIDGSL